MEIREIKLYDCMFDSELKESKDNKLSTVTKVKIGDFENIILFEFSKEQGEYLKNTNQEGVLFNVVGSFQVRKNKKEVPFLFLKVDSIISLEDLEKRKKEIREKYNAEKKEKQKIKAQKEMRLRWTEKIEELCGNPVKIDYRKIDFVDKEHLKNSRIDFSAKYIECKELKCVVSQNSDSDRYRLVFGWKQLITAKLFDKDIDVYIFNGSKDELIEKLSVD